MLGNNIPAIDEFEEGETQLLTKQHEEFCNLDRHREL